MAGKPSLVAYACLLIEMFAMPGLVKRHFDLWPSMDLQDVKAMPI